HASFSLPMDCSPTFCVPGLWNPFTIFCNRSSRRHRRLHSLGLAAMPEKRPFERLPADVSPINYSLCLKPDLLDFTFEGKLEAAAQVRQATNQIVMNCADIDIITASYAPEGDEDLVFILSLLYLLFRSVLTFGNSLKILFFIIFYFSFFSP
uniref:Aminopeptidase puromycin sensitive n=1 Tax=Equus asinus asinus TaxID=83772 RepID=A0A8C4PFU8_EQUAS